MNAALLYLQMSVRQEIRQITSGIFRNCLSKYKYCQYTLSSVSEIHPAYNRSDYLKQNQDQAG